MVLQSNAGRLIGGPYSTDVRSSRRVFEKLISHTASRHIPFQQVLGAQHRPLENEHRPPSGMQVCRPALTTEVMGVKKAQITINMAPANFNSEVFFICFLLRQIQIITLLLTLNTLGKPFEGAQ